MLRRLVVVALVEAPRLNPATGEVTIAGVTTRAVGVTSPSVIGQDLDL